MTFNAAEKYQSQVPAIQTLVALGFKPLSQGQADKLRGKSRNVVLDDILQFGEPPVAVVLPLFRWVAPRDSELTPCSKWHAAPSAIEM